ncbi:hypothetical protein SBRCBS47491_008807 [Sporothrix bragantina]|uniref:Aminoglycoside phosphotransferase domain-containing protein n=1 Tax=Sporothrix bragantina TaxID=671064 RepID=A0ABP0CR00_9PEZI
MPYEPRRTCADKDDLIWEKLDERIDEWYKSVRTNDMYRAVARFILKYKPGDVELMHRALKGAYNITYRLEYKNSSSVIMRIPIKGSVPFQDEKVRYEVAMMRYVAANTTIPNFSRALMDTTRVLGKPPILDPNIDEQRLASIYAQDSIIPATNKTYDTADSWFAALDDVNLAQLVFQRRDAVEDADDARDKYVARQFFRQAAANGCLAPDDGQTVSLYSEDLRPANILLDKDGRIIGVFDWEFAYAAPLSFSNIEKQRASSTDPPTTTTAPGVAPLSQRMRANWVSNAWMRNYAAWRSWAFDFLW